MVSISVIIGKRIKEIRESRHIKQVELANMIDIEPTNLSKIEKGIHLPKDETLQKIITALDTDIQNILHFEHLINKDELINNINKILIEANKDDLRFFYRTMLAYNESK